MSGPITLVFMAAGMGSRFGGLKQLAEVGPGGEALIAPEFRARVLRPRFAAVAGQCMITSCARLCPDALHSVAAASPVRADSATIASRCRRSASRRPKPGWSNLMPTTSRWASRSRSIVLPAIRTRSGTAWTGSDSPPDPHPPSRIRAASSPAHTGRADRPGASPVISTRPCPTR